MNLPVLSYTHVFIDFDGTLVDSVQVLFEHYANFLLAVDRKGTFEEFKSLMGPTIHEFVPILKRIHHLEHPEDELIELYKKDIDKRYDSVSLLPSALQFLKLAKELHIPLTVVTSSHFPLVERALKNLQIEEYFSFILTAELVTKTKPDKEIYELALKKNNCSCEKALAIEDSISGIMAATDAHIQTIALQDSDEPLPPLAYRLKNWPAIISLFKEAYGK